MYVRMRKAEDCVDTGIGLLVSALLSGGRVGAITPFMDLGLARADRAGGAGAELGFALGRTLRHRFQTRKIVIAGMGTII